MKLENIDLARQLIHQREQVERDLKTIKQDRPGDLMYFRGVELMPSSRYTKVFDAVHEVLKDHFEMELGLLDSKLEKL